MPIFNKDCYNVTQTDNSPFEPIKGLLKGLQYYCSISKLIIHFTDNNEQDYI